MSLAVFLLIVLSASYLLYRLRVTVETTNEKNIPAASADGEGGAAETAQQDGKEKMSGKMSGKLSGKFLIELV
jgi:hypothetical protein